MINNEKIKEYARNFLFSSNMIEKFEIFSRENDCFVPFLLSSKQREIIDAFETNRFNIVLKSRQTGVSSVTNAYIANKSAFLIDDPENILIVASNISQASHQLKNIKEFLKQIPRSHWGPDYVGTQKNENKNIFIVNTSTLIKLPNGSIIKAVSSSKDAFRGFQPTMVIFDEAAYYRHEGILSMIIPSLGTQGKLILQSTPNGNDSFFSRVYNDAKNGENNFNIVNVKWYHDSRYNVNLCWTRNDETIIEEEFMNDLMDSKLENGWKPTSEWYEFMCRNYDYDQRKISQELNAQFI